jgi:hypothetical protein
MGIQFLLVPKMSGRDNSNENRYRTADGVLKEGLVA